MKITTRAVYDMTDPRFWDGDMQEACICEEAFEYEGEVALCGRGSDGYGDGSSSSNESSGQSNSNGLGGGGNSGNNDSDSVGSSWGSDAAALARAEQQAGLSHGFSSIGVDNSETSWNWSDGWHNRSTQAVKPSKLGGFMTTSYGWQHPEEAARQYAAARNRQKADTSSMMSAIPARIQSQWANNPAMQMRLNDALTAGRLNDLTAAGVMTDDEAAQMVDTHGGPLDRIGQAMNMPTDDLRMPAESYVEALDKGLIDPDGSLTTKGTMSTYGGLAGMFAAPAAGALMTATGSLPAALAGYAGLKLGSGYARSQGMAGSPASEALGTAASMMGAPGMAMDNLQQASNMAGLATATGYGRQAETPVAAPETREAGGADNNMFADLVSGAVSAPAAQAVAAAEPNHFSEYKARTGSGTTPATSTGFLPGVSPAVKNMFSDLMV
jgi:hypothetical protein